MLGEKKNHALCAPWHEIKWVKEKQNSRFQSITSITRTRRSDANRDAAEPSAHPTPCTFTSSYQEHKHSLSLSVDGREGRWQPGANMHVTLGRWCRADNRTQRLKSVFKKPGIIMMWQRFLTLCSCYLRTLTRSYLKPPSFSVIGESQSTAEDNNLPSITILPTLVWLHKLSLSCINLELNPWGWGINRRH